MSNQLKAFVGHSFTDNDSVVVNKFLKFFTTVTKMNIGFSWEHAEEAEAKELAEKVKALVEDKNLFIGICTNKEAVIDPTKLTKARFNRKMFKAEKAAFFSKTSDWIIQEIGLAIGRNMNLILLLENGVREPGGLQGNYEYIPFDREAPEKSFSKILETIKSIFPKAKTSFADQTESRAVPEEKDRAEENHSEDRIELNADSGFEEFRLELFIKVMRGDEEGIKNIKECILSSNLGQEQKIIEDWTALEEYYRILHGKGGNFIRFEALAKKHPENVHIQKFLALAYKKYDDHYKAAILFKSAAEKSKSKDIELSLYGKAAISFAKDNKSMEMNIMISKMKALAAEVENGENELIETLREIAEITKDDDLYFGVTEQLLKINPGDNASRFNLAYRYSNTDQDELSLFHYLKIPYRERSQYSWNNLGVAFELCNINNNSVKAYKQADQMDYTLAMSNLAKKLIKAGFLEEAEEICNRAFKVKDYHKNILDDVSRIKAIPEEEEKKEKTILEKVSPLSEFYREYGCASLRDNPGDLEGQWRGPLCDLTVTIRNNNFTATGTYESGGTGLNYLSLATALGVTPNKKRSYKVKYEGQVFGRTIKGFFIESVDEEPHLASPTTLLGSRETDKKVEVLMILSDSLEEIRVNEKGKNKDFKFYSLKRIT